jgi:hypothetical protein
MSSPREQFDALLRAAAAARHEEAVTPPPYGLETRVLAAWRSSRGAPLLLDNGVLVRGLILAGLLMAVSIWPALKSLNSNADSENLQLADSSVQTDWAP